MSETAYATQFEQIPYHDPIEYFAAFSNDTWAVILDGAPLHDTTEDTQQYSYIAFSPFDHLIIKNNHILTDNYNTCNNPLDYLQKKLSSFSSPFIEKLPPFQGGAMGYLGYDLCHYLENIPYPNSDDMAFPDMVFGFYDLVIGFEHATKQAWIISTGHPEIDFHAREHRAKKRLRWAKQKLNPTPITAIYHKQSVGSINKESLSQNFTAKQYQEMVKKTINFIRAGDIFEANLSQRYIAPLSTEIKPFDLYCRQRRINHAPFSAFMNYGDHQIASASPERFLKCINGQVETRPIKGTCPRNPNNKEDDQQLANELLKSEKDIAENVMIVDLMRNDLSRVCKDDSIKVSKLCALESFSTVHHLVSVITGKLRPEYDVLDLLNATFPGGSITGAPKIRAMEIIAELEPNRRGPYCGSIGYIGFNGNLDMSITIRTYCIKNNTVSFQAGGAIVVDSDPITEYQESLNKAWALKEALVNWQAYQ